MAKTNPSLSWSVIGTLAWFGLRKRPLTAEELAQVLLKQTSSPETIKNILDKDGRVAQQNGFYSLKDDEVRYPTPESLRYYRYKWWRLKLALGLIRHVPFVRMVGVLQTVADRTATEASDIDVLIIAEHGRLYLVRTLITLLLQMAGLRRHGEKITDRVCLSWFASTDHLDMAPITFPPYDILLLFLFAEMIPVLDEGGTYERFVATNGWVKTAIPAYAPRPVSPTPLSPFARWGERVLNGRLGSFLERRLMTWQQKRISENPANPDPDVRIIATESMLKFHEKERRRKDREAWEARMRALGEDPSLIH